MRAGSINRRLSIDQPIETQNETGELVVGWSERAKVWAQISPLRGRDALVAGANLSVMDTKITMRWTPEINSISSKWRLRYNGIIYDILSVAPVDMNRREVEILAKSGTNQG